MYDELGATTTHVRIADAGHWPEDTTVRDGFEWVYNELGWITTGNWNAADDYSNHG